MDIKTLTEVVDFLLPITLLLNAVAYLPQIWRLYKTKESKDLSQTTFWLFWIGILLVILHGFLSGDPIVGWSYLPSIVVCSITLILIIRYRNKP